MIKITPLNELIDKSISDNDTIQEVVKKICDNIIERHKKYAPILKTNYIAPKKRDSAKAIAYIKLEKEIFYSKGTPEKSVESFIRMSYDAVNGHPVFGGYINAPDKYNVYGKFDKNDKKEVSFWEKVFDYDGIMSHVVNGITLRNHLMSLLDVDVCPYCNRQYITRYQRPDKKGQRTTADLDHYFVKSKYPIFALSFFNFIPACGVCNSTFKNDKDTGENGSRPLYPGKYGFGKDAVFEVDVDVDVKKDPAEYARKKIEVLSGINTEDMKLSINNSPSGVNKKSIDSSIEIFALNEVYQSHKKNVRDILLKNRVFDSGGYLDFLKTTLGRIYSNDSGTKKDISETEFKALLYGFTFDKGSWDHSSRPLSKLTYDILKLYKKEK